jgi:hypothetical protein
MGRRDSTENAVNEPRSAVKTDTPVTRGRSGPVRYEIVSKEGTRIGPYDTADRAFWWAHQFFPDQEQDEDRTGKGWDVQVVGS